MSIPFIDTLDIAVSAEEKLILASVGDIDALRSLARDAYTAIGSDELSSTIAWVEAITYARLAAMQGEARDCEVLFFLIANFATWQRDRGQPGAADRFEGAALNIAAHLADLGDEMMASIVVEAGARLPSQIFEEARRQREETT